MSVVRFPLSEWPVSDNGRRITDIVRYPDQPPLAHTGGFNEPTCQRCHFGAALNDPAGAIQLSLPDAYQPGRTYQLQVELTRPGLRRAGFQLAARFSDGSAAGRQAGTLRTHGERLTVAEDSTGIQYAQHRHAGSEPTAPGRAAWKIEWSAPMDGGRVVFHLVGNAANDDASEFGDYVYTVSRVVGPRYFPPWHE